MGKSILLFTGQRACRVQSAACSPELNMNRRTGRTLSLSLARPARGGRRSCFGGRAGGLRRSGAMAWDADRPYYIPALIRLGLLAGGQFAHLRGPWAPYKGPGVPADLPPTLVIGPPDAFRSIATSCFSMALRASTVAFANLSE